jgi:hypothetical protein
MKTLLLRGMRSASNLSAAEMVAGVAAGDGAVEAAGVGVCAAAAAESVSVASAARINLIEACPFSRGLKC